MPPKRRGPTYKTSPDDDDSIAVAHGTLGTSSTIITIDQDVDLAFHRLSHPESTFLAAPPSTTPSSFNQPLSTQRRSKFLSATPRRKTQSYSPERNSPPCPWPSTSPPISCSSAAARVSLLPATPAPFKPTMPSIPPPPAGGPPAARPAAPAAPHVVMNAKGRSYTILPDNESLLTSISPPNQAGKEPNNEKYCGGAIFLDIASNFVFVRHQHNLTGAMAVKSKHAFERYADEFGIRIQEYLCDNHPFNSQDFVQDCTNQHQNLIFPGVGAHHQNRVERANHTIFNWSRIMLLHYILNWPQQARLDLWPFAVDYAVWLWNHIPDLGTRMSPLEIFTNATFPDFRLLHRVRVFGCPVYVLDAKIQDGKKLPKWQKRTWQGIFLGFSTSHHSTVALVLNPETGSITCQYHVVFDEKFSTVAATSVHDDSLDVWDTLLDSGYDQHDSPEIPEPEEELNPAWLPPHVINPRLLDTDNTVTEVQPATPTSEATSQTDTVTQTATTTQTDPPPEPVPQVQLSPKPLPNNRRVTFDDTTQVGNPPETIAQTLPRRQVNPPSRLIDSMDAKQRTYLSGNLSKQTHYKPGSNLPRVAGSHLNNLRLPTLQWDKLRETCIKGTYGAFLSELNRNTDGEFIEEWNPALLATKANQEDTPNWNTAMNGPHAAGFWKACQDAIDALTKKECWDVVPRPPDRPVVSGTWAFRIKRFPDGSMRKLKARFCARGYEPTEGVDFTETLLRSSTGRLFVFSS